MAEHRFPKRSAEAASSPLPALLPQCASVPAVRGWFVQDAADAVAQPFYAALDCNRRVCWTDILAQAHPFRSKSDADRFILDRMTSEARVVGRS